MSTPAVRRVAPAVTGLLATALALRSAGAEPADEELESPHAGHSHEGEAVEVEVRAERTPAESASRIDVGRRELELRPRRRPGDLLEAAPGLFVAQHAGGGKANQYFLRGFDADHGTDVALSVDRIPVNAVSHGHGQGYSDVAFVIPELVGAVEVWKGPHHAELGDFATAGAVNLRLVDALPEDFASVSVGAQGIRRGVVAASPSLPDGFRALVAAELWEHDGPFVNPDRYRKLNVLARATRDLERGGKLTFTATSSAGRWNGSGQIPARAVCGEGEVGLARPGAYGEPCLERFGSVDPTEGGATQRHSGSISYSATSHEGAVDALVYGVASRFNLYSNFTFFARDPVNGDGIEQRDDRFTYGVDVRARRHLHHAGSVFTTALGVQARADTIENALHDQAGRERLGTRVSADIDETQLGVYLLEDARLTQALRLVAGLRVQKVDVAVDDRLEDLATRAGATSGGEEAALLLPKFTAIVTPVGGWQLFGHLGRGFHSNDARGAALRTRAADLLTPALGYELGSRVEPTAWATLNAAAFVMDLDSELVWVGDDGVTEASGATRRLGLELSARVHLNGWLFADTDLTVTRARYRYEPEGADRIPLAPVRTFTAGVGARRQLGRVTPFGSLRVKTLSDRPATEDGSLVADGYAVLDAEAGARVGAVEASLTVQNALDAQVREANFATTSRLPYEPSPVTGVHYTPGWPRTVLARATLFW
ncbi:MAG: TonB-dependent receptor [Deltaproteobacteria bacterium]|nr:TonB-dependent receptor [Deltaproteobacteria bacterium]